MRAPAEPVAVSGSDAGPGADEAFSAPTDEQRHLDAAESVQMWAMVSRFAPVTSRYGHARTVCLTMVRPRVPNDEAASRACVPPYVWRFLDPAEAPEVEDPSYVRRVAIE